MSKQIADIQYGGTNEDFVWRSPITDFESGSVLTVGETQDALFYLNGECVGILGENRHILDTEHVPFLKKLYNKVTGNQTIFHAQICFVNKVVLEIKWGAADIVYQDPMGPVFKIGCHGKMFLKAEESRKLVEMLVGEDVCLKTRDVENKFRELIAAEIADSLVNTMISQQISITAVKAHLKEISENVKPDLSRLLSSYGFSVQEFVIYGVQEPEDDPEYKRLLRLLANQGLRMSELSMERQEALNRQQIEADKIEIMARAQAGKRRMEGYTYQEEQHFKLANNFIENGGASGLSSDLMNVGAGLGMMRAVSGMVQQAVDPCMNTASVPMGNEGGKFCMYCGQNLPLDAKFCRKCGRQQE